MDKVPWEVAHGSGILQRPVPHPPKSVPEVNGVDRVNKVNESSKREKGERREREGERERERAHTEMNLGRN